MLRDENRHRDKDSNHKDQGGCPNATAPRREIARAGVRQIARRCGAAAGRRSHRGADLAAVSGWVKGGPRKAAVPWDRVEVAAGSREALGCRVAGRGVAKPMQAIDRSFHSFLDRRTPASAALLPQRGGPWLGTKRGFSCFLLGRCDSALNVPCLRRADCISSAPGMRACVTTQRLTLRRSKFACDSPLEGD
jgi:hypothetical protein